VSLTRGDLSIADTLSLPPSDTPDETATD
jgi:hypothetical protein